MNVAGRGRTVGKEWNDKCKARLVGEMGVGLFGAVGSDGGGFGKSKGSASPGAGFEPAISGLACRCSTLLSYPGLTEWLGYLILSHCRISNWP